MYLSRLELHGFKSFAQKTTLAFDAGVTCIVGPNGCGKSNVVDAVRWVVGEQRARALRSEKMENVIFNGSGGRRPLGLAEVLLTVENTRGVLPTEFSEVTLGRRLYRSGESEYLLNGQACRLRDVQDLFMDTGMGAGAYSVIELAMVEEILSESDEDRRRLFEEAAGVTKYKLRRRQALGRLDGTQADLTRLRDLTTELGTRVASLRRQADKAARFRDLDTRRALLETTLAHAEHARLGADHEAVTARLSVLRADLEAAAAALARLETDADRLALVRTEREAERAARQADLQAHVGRLRDADAERRLSEERVARAAAEAERLRREHGEAAARRAALDNTRARFEQEAASAEPAARAASETLRSARAARDAAQATIDAARADAQALRAREDAATRAQGEAARALDRLAARADGLAAERARLTAALDAPPDAARAARARTAAREADAAAHAHAALEAEIARAEAAEADAAAARADLLARRREAERARAAVQGEAGVLDRLVRSYDGLARGPKFLAARGAWHAGALVTVADVLRAGDGAGPALAAALGRWAACPVAETDAEAEAALDLLREHGEGQATILVLERLPAPAAAEPVAGAEPLAARVAPVHARYGALRDALLAGVHLAPDAAGARALARAHPAACFVAPDGGWAMGAAVHGGSAEREAEAPPSRLAQRERLDALRADLAALDATLAAVADDERALAARPGAGALPALRARLADAARAVRAADAALARAQSDEAADARAADARRARIAEIELETAALRDGEAPLQAALAEHEADATRARDARLRAEAAVLAAEAGASAAFAAFNEAGLDDARTRGRLDTLRADLARTASAAGHLEREQRERERRLGTLEHDVRAARAALRDLEAAVAELADARAPLEAAALDAETALLAATATISDHERALRDARRARETVLRDESEAGIRAADLAARLGALRDAYEQAHGEPLEPGAVAVPEGFEPDAARAEAAALRQRIAALGSVNALALEAYEEENTRLGFLLAQQADLEEAEATLKSTITEINAAAAARFMETFERIRTSFAGLFRELFGEEAAADVALTRPSDPLESPIEITARPSGKRPSAITQLSGGEKTLAAIALLFSIYLVKPSPFCILDEVDAPLDEANVDRFMRLIRRFSEQTQFLLVTHNRRTMELADRLYGITMQEPGVSRVVTVRFEEAAEMAE